MNIRSYIVTRIAQLRSYGSIPEVTRGRLYELESLLEKVI